MKKLTIIMSITLSAFLFACNNQSADSNENNHTPAALDTAVGIIPDTVKIDTTGRDTSTMRH